MKRDKINSNQNRRAQKNSSWEVYTLNKKKRYLPGVIGRTGSGEFGNEYEYFKSQHLLN